MDAFEWVWSVDYAARADGECTGWTRPLAVWMSIASGIVALAYLGISAALVRSQSILPRRLVVPFSLFIVVCGLGHAFDAAANFVPAYGARVLWEWFVAAVSLWAMAVIARDSRSIALINRSDYDEIRGHMSRVREIQGDVANDG